MINVIGLGYIGLPTALMMASHGVEVVGTDYNKKLVDTLNAGKTTFKEDGLDELFDDAVKAVPSIVDSECRYHEGDIVPDGNTLRQIMLRFVLICNNRKQLVKDIEYINNTVKVLDVDGQNMCYTFDAKSYYNFYDNNK